MQMFLERMSVMRLQRSSVGGFLSVLVSKAFRQAITISSCGMLVYKDVTCNASGYNRVL